MPESEKEDGRIRNTGNMNTEDEVQYGGCAGWHTFGMLYATFTGDKGENRWRAWKGPHFIAQADTHDEVIERAKRIVDRRELS